MNYEQRVYSVTYNGETKNLSKEDFNKEIENHEYYFIPEVPTYVDGANVNAHCFNTKGKLLKFIEKMKREDYAICMGLFGEIVEVCQDGTTWWVLGYTNLPFWTFPYWSDYKEEARKNNKKVKTTTKYVILENNYTNLQTNINTLSLQI